MRALDWLFRTAMLALAGLVTLSMLASIAAISTETGPAGWVGIDRPRSIGPETEPDPGRTGRTTTASTDSEEAGTAGAAESVAAEREPGRWLEAIAYGLLAIAGLIAIALLLLASAARDLKRIADGLSGRPR